MDIKVPAMGESVTEGTLANWLVKPGQAVKQDDPIAEIETDKVAIEVPAPAAGVITEHLVKAGETVQIGTIIATLQEGGTASAAPAAKPAAAAAPAAKPSASAAPAAPATKATDKIAPSVGRIAAEANVNPADIPGSGKGGRATKCDALNYVASTPAPAAARGPAADVPHTPRELGPREERVKMTRLRQTIARRLKEAQNTAAMLTTFNDVDMSEVMELRKRHQLQIPEEDYPHLASLNSCVNYLEPLLKNA